MFNPNRDFDESHWPKASKEDIEFLKHIVDLGRLTLELSEFTEKTVYITQEELDRVFSIWMKTGTDHRGALMTAPGQRECRTRAVMWCGVGTVILSSEK